MTLSLVFIAFATVAAGLPLLVALVLACIPSRSRLGSGRAARPARALGSGGRVVASRGRITGHAVASP